MEIKTGSSRTVKVRVVSFQTIRRDLMNALRKKRPALYNNIENVILHQEAMHPVIPLPGHSWRSMCWVYRELRTPPYSPDLALLDFSYFPQLKSHLRANRFQDREELMYAIQEFNRVIR